MELLELFYKKYTDTVEALDYVDWAKHYLYMDVLEIQKLASMEMETPLNIFEIEKMFDDAMVAMNRDAPSMEQCIDYHLKQLHAKLLKPVEDAILVVKEIYNCAIEHNVLDVQMDWQEMSDAIDDFQYGDNLNGYTLDKINKMIMTHGRKIWHTKLSNMSFKEIIGQKVKAIDTETHFIIELEKGAIIIECPWRIRDTDCVLLGETDVQSNAREWKAVEELLLGKTIEDIQLLEHCPLLIVQCGHIFLDLFHASSFFDGWTITDEDDLYVFSMHGGSIA